VKRGGVPCVKLNAHLRYSPPAACTNSAHEGVRATGQSLQVADVDTRLDKGELNGWGAPTSSW
jgi:hypothetical protein